MPTERLFTPDARDESTADMRAMARISAFMETPLNSRMDVDRLVRAGLPAAFAAFVAAPERHYSMQEFRWAIPPRTLAQRQARGERLNPDESGKMMRAARLTLMAEELFGDARKAARWMRRPLSALGGASALDAMQTEAGGQAVEDLLMQMEFGHFA